MMEYVIKFFMTRWRICPNNKQNKVQTKNQLKNLMLLYSTYFLMDHFTVNGELQYSVICAMIIENELDYHGTKIAIIHVAAVKIGFEMTDKMKHLMYHVLADPDMKNKYFWLVSTPGIFDFSYYQKIKDNTPDKMIHPRNAFMDMGFVVKSEEELDEFIFPGSETMFAKGISLYENTNTGISFAKTYRVCTINNLTKQKVKYENGTFKLYTYPFNWNKATTDE